MAVTERKPMTRVRLEKISRDVHAFCAEHGIEEFLRQAIAVARHSFRPIRKIETRLQADPDADETRVVVDVTVESDIPSALAMKRTYTQQWVKLAPPRVRNLIRLLYNII